MDAVEREIERLDMLLKASEDWADSYKNAPDKLAKLIKLETKLERLVRLYFKSLAYDRLDAYINWNLYQTKVVKAYRFDVIVDVEMIDEIETEELLTVLHEPLQLSMAFGATSAEVLYNIDLGLNRYHEAVMKATDKYVADLVKGVNQTTKDRISKSISQSILNGEDITDAKQRMQNVISDPKRAELIARTETVRSYGKGLELFGEESNATGKKWEVSSNPCSICSSNNIGMIPFSETFPSGHKFQPAHPRCRCDVSLEHDYS